MESFRTDMSFLNYEDADKVQRKLLDIKRDKGIVTYADFLQVKYSSNYDYPDIYKNHGWYSLAGMTIEFNYDSAKYYLKMPQIIYLKNKIEKEN